jgi:hypothetical protein
MSRTKSAAGKKGKKKEEEIEEITQGNGVFIFSDNCKYTGDWLIAEGVKRKHGKGTYIEGDNIYKGDFSNDEMHGQGEMTFASGATYIGQFVHNKFEGQGTYVWPDNSSYTGSWRNNRMHGDGVYTSADGKRWIGKFYNGNAEGLERELIDL